MKRIFSPLAIIVLILSVQPVSFATGNLPQVQAQSRIKGKDNRRLVKYFNAINDLQETLDSAIEVTITRNIPAVYRKGRERMVKAWGKDAQGQSRTLIRPLSILQQPGEKRNVLLTFTCYSLIPQFARYYDERLMVLTIDSTASSLTVFPPNDLCDSCTTLTRIGLDDTLRVAGKPAVSLTFTTSNMNPCCPTTDSVMQEIHNYYSFTGHSVEQILSLLKSRREVHQTRGESRSINTVDVDLYFEKDSGGNLSKVVATKSSTINNQPQPTRITWFEWNGKMQRFVETQH